MRFILLLGSNVGNREQRLAEAVLSIADRIGRPDAISGIYQTAPWGKTDQDPFLNQVVSGECNLQPRQLLESVLQIELSMGRVRTSKWAPRIIDIDILFFGKQVVSEPGLVIPHPMLHERRFTLQPLCD
ncbi:MAG: 2-amino-4-hydroxy-6-hydroxymethyldihydropteridine diphosphokinase, partial [Bacteroidota bacterium]